MAENFTLKVESRDKLETGKGPNKKLRRNSYVPGVFYNKEGENIPLKVYYGSFEKLYAQAHKSNVVYLKIKDKEQEIEKPVLIWNVQEHPFKNLILHVDFLGVDLKQEMDVEVPIEVTGQSKGEENGGIVSYFRDAIEVTCLPTSIPDSIQIDITDLDINDNIYIMDLKFPEGVTLKEVEENYAVVGIMPPETEEVKEEEGEEEVGEEEEESKE